MSIRPADVEARREAVADYVEDSDLSDRIYRGEFDEVILLSIAEDWTDEETAWEIEVYHA